MKYMRRTYINSDWIEACLEVGISKNDVVLMDLEEGYDGTGAFYATYTIYKDKIFMCGSNVDCFWEKSRFKEVDEIEMLLIKKMEQMK